MEALDRLDEVVLDACEKRSISREDWSHEDGCDDVRCDVLTEAGTGGSGFSGAGKGLVPNMWEAVEAQDDDRV
jgi:hypothetical protein